MALYSAAYRLTVMAPATSDATETTALTPASGAPHSQAFQVATMQGITGFQPYLGFPEGRKGRYDPSSGRVDIGTLSFRLLDKRTGSGNLQRWVSAFIGSSDGKNNLVGRRVVVEESLNGGSTWTAYYVGRITECALDDVLWYRIDVGEGSEALKWQAFVNAPYTGATNAALATLIPLGMTAPYSAYTNTNIPVKVSGTYQAGSVNMSGFPSYRQIVFDEKGSAGVNLPVNVLNDGAKKALHITETQHYATAMSHPDLFSKYRVDVQCGSKHQQFQIAAVLPVAKDGLRAKALQLGNPDNSNECYLSWTGVATETFSVGDKVACYVYAMNAPISEENPLFINDTHPAQIMKDVVLGYYGYLDGAGNPYSGMAIDNAAFDALIANTTFAYPRFKITKKQAVNDFIEKELGPFGLGYRVVASGSGNTATHVFVPFDTRIPASGTIGVLPTLTDNDVAEISGEWGFTKPAGALAIKYYLETQEKTTTANVSEWLLTEQESEQRVVYPEHIKANGEDIQLDIRGIRGTFEEATQTLKTPTNVMKAIQRHQEERFVYGPPTIGITCRRTTVPNSLQLGQWVLVQVSHLPDMQTHARGGTRLMQVTERTEKGETIEFGMMDAGLNALATPPTFGTPSLVDGNTIAIPVALSVAGTLDIDVASVAAGASRPADTSDLWNIVYVGTPATTGMVTYTVDKLPSGMKHYIRARSKGNGVLPSAWVAPTPDYVTTTSLVAVTGLAFSNISGSSVLISWNNNGDVTNAVQINVASPNTARLVPCTLLMAGSTMYPLTGLSTDAGANPYMVEVLHRDMFGGSSPSSTVTFTLSGSVGRCPIPRKITTQTTTTGEDGSDPLGGLMWNKYHNL